MSALTVPTMYNIDTHLYGCTIYVYFCNSHNIVDGFVFSNDIIVFPLCYRVIKFVFVFISVFPFSYQ